MKKKINLAFFKSTQAKPTSTKELLQAQPSVPSLAVVPDKPLAPIKQDNIATLKVNQKGKKENPLRDIKRA